MNLGRLILNCIILCAVSCIDKSKVDGSERVITRSTLLDSDSRDAAIQFDPVFEGKRVRAIFRVLNRSLLEVPIRIVSSSCDCVAVQLCDRDGVRIRSMASQAVAEIIVDARVSMGNSSHQVHVAMGGHRLHCKIDTVGSPRISVASGRPFNMNLIPGRGARHSMRIDRIDDSVCDLSLVSFSKKTFSAAALTRTRSDVWCLLLEVSSLFAGAVDVKVTLEATLEDGSRVPIRIDGVVARPRKFSASCGNFIVMSGDKPDEVTVEFMNFEGRPAYVVSHAVTGSHSMAFDSRRTGDYSLAIERRKSSRRPRSELSSAKLKVHLVSDGIEGYVQITLQDLGY